MKLVNLKENNQFFTTREEIKEWLLEVFYDSSYFRINDDLTVDIVKSGLDLGDRGQPRKVQNGIIPVKFNYIAGAFFCDGLKLTSLDFAPKIIKGNFNCSNNNITNLHNIHKIIKQIDGTFRVYNNPLKSNVLGLLLIKGLIGVLASAADPYFEVFQIINRYLEDGPDLNLCQEELIQAGYADFAKL